MHMLRWICGPIRKDRVGNDDIHEIRGDTNQGEACTPTEALRGTGS
jgi:hypothetical protein